MCLIYPVLQLFHKNVQASFNFASLMQAHDAEVEGMAFDIHHRCVATVGGGCLKVWDIGMNGMLTFSD